MTPLMSLSYTLIRRLTTRTKNYTTSQSSLKFAVGPDTREVGPDTREVGPDTREGYHYISASKTYLD